MSGKRFNSVTDALEARRRMHQKERLSYRVGQAARRRVQRGVELSYKFGSVAREAIADLRTAYVERMSSTKRKPSLIRRVRQPEQTGRYRAYSRSTPWKKVAATIAGGAFVLAAGHTLLNLYQASPAPKAGTESVSPANGGRASAILDDKLPEACEKWGLQLQVGVPDGLYVSENAYGTVQGLAQACEDLGGASSQMIIHTKNDGKNLARVWFRYGTSSQLGKIRDFLESKGRSGSIVARSVLTGDRFWNMDDLEGQLLNIPQRTGLAARVSPEIEQRMLSDAQWELLQKSLQQIQGSVLAGYDLPELVDKAGRSATPITPFVVDAIDKYELCDFIFPVDHNEFTSMYNPKRFHPKKKRWLPHNGVDIDAAYREDVKAAQAGVIVGIDEQSGGAGRYVTIEHEGGLRTRYMHLDRFRKGLYEGQQVDQGYVIGGAGRSGSATEVHVHFEMMPEKEKFVDPVTVLQYCREKAREDDSFQMASVQQGQTFASR